MTTPVAALLVVLLLAVAVLLGMVAQLLVAVRALTDEVESLHWNRSRS